jgi:hypothetical protein
VNAKNFLRVCTLNALIFSGAAMADGDCYSTDIPEVPTIRISGESASYRVIDVVRRQYQDYNSQGIEYTRNDGQKEKFKIDLENSLSEKKTYHAAVDGKEYHRDAFYTYEKIGAPSAVKTELGRVYESSFNLDSKQPYVGAEFSIEVSVKGPVTFEGRLFGFSSRSRTYSGKITGILPENACQ